MPFRSNSWLDPCPLPSMTSPTNPPASCDSTSPLARSFVSDDNTRWLSTCGSNSMSRTSSTNISPHALFREREPVDDWRHAHPIQLRPLGLSKSFAVNISNPFCRGIQRRRRILVEPRMS
ncbi:hypothetical protein AMAG_19801 [Allomyces macrogynus ATCC 38327]|uniref:Uncharacterized protein n=1 Tax=Allomyces macrogynus (strain ATCC 38327) TaxID=578462 RepID=A0A0L0T0U2_ALLM3|nr:hypothetical protein AMAG_19801 [Allomyces macrogynus ATCC 38327]|eukprot:KNE68381.1 hypothetical protein AMAG_19801 [Allomyces macrogynus ATCC 38327]